MIAAVTDTPQRAGINPSYRQGFEEGYRQGLQAGSLHFGTRFEGTSIIIPTYNQLHFLKQCLNSIHKHTESPYEIIVVDNNSGDGTSEYLESLRGEVRFRVLDANRGFAGAVNVGLMMAKGSTIVLLNNDTLVTPNWLRNMLFCLYSDPRIGMVGPVTNFISGQQKIHVPYRKLEDMQAFARRHNHRRPRQWRDAEWLMGYCLLFRRELFEELGYWDEGFEFGNFEDNDYNIRVRLSGKRLVIARDTFIHHFGSVSIRAMGDALAGFNARNQSYFLAKWNNPSAWIAQVDRQRAGQPGGAAAAHALYPERVAVQGISGPVYWIEGGQRHPVQGELSFPPVFVSQIDLRRWPIGEPVHAGDAERRWRGLDDPAGWEAGVAVLSNGALYHLEGNLYRRIIGYQALESWHLHLKPVRLITEEELTGRSEGLPVIPLPILKQRL